MWSSDLADMWWCRVNCQTSALLFSERNVLSTRQYTTHLHRYVQVSFQASSCEIYILLQFLVPVLVHVFWISLVWFLYFIKFAIYILCDVKMTCFNGSIPTSSKIRIEKLSILVRKNARFSKWDNVQSIRTKTADFVLAVGWLSRNASIRTLAMTKF